MSKLENSSIYPSFMRGRAGEWWSVANLLLLQPGNSRHHTPSDGGGNNVMEPGVGEGCKWQEVTLNFFFGLLYYLLGF